MDDPALLSSWFLAIEQSDLLALSRLLQQGVSIHTLHSSGSPALLLADYSRDDLLHFLLDHGADVHVANAHGTTPLHLAALHSSESILQRLIPLYSDLDVLNVFEQTPLFLAVFHQRLRQAQCLLEHGADVHFSTPSGSLLSHACRLGDVSMVELLLRHGASPHPSTDLAPPLHSVCHIGHAYLVELLLQAHANPDAIYDDQFPLKIAAMHGFTTCLSRLIQDHAHLDLMDSDGMTALMMACLHGQTAAVSTLLSAQASVHLTNHEGYSAFHYAASSYQPSLPLMNLLFQNGADLSLLTSEGCTPFHLYCHQPALSLDIFRWFLQPDHLLFDVNQPNSSGVTPLMTLASLGTFEALPLLLAHGAFLDIQDHCGRTALMHAFDHGYCRSAGVLLRLGADPFLRDHQGRSFSDRLSSSDDPSWQSFLPLIAHHSSQPDPLLSSGADSVSLSSSPRFSL